MTLRYTEQINRGEKTDWFEILPLELQTDADRTSGAFASPLHPGLMLKVTLANEAAAFSATVNLQTPDADGTWTTIYTSAALTANGTTLIYIYPGGGTNSLFTIVPFSLPRIWRVLLDYTGTPDTDMADTRVQGCLVI